MKKLTVLFFCFLLSFFAEGCLVASEGAKKEITALSQSNVQQVMDTAPLLVIDVYADWCGPCKRLGPIFEELHTEYGSVYQFAKFNAENEPALADKFNIERFPTIIFIKNGKEVGRGCGFQTKEKLLASIKQHLGNS